MEMTKWEKIKSILIRICYTNNKYGNDRHIARFIPYTIITIVTAFVWIGLDRFTEITGAGVALCSIAFACIFTLTVEFNYPQQIEPIAGTAGVTLLFTILALVLTSCLPMSASVERLTPTHVYRNDIGTVVMYGDAVYLSKSVSIYKQDSVKLCKYMRYNVWNDRLTDTYNICGE